jgi:hypothetical protein
MADQRSLFVIPAKAGIQSNRTSLALDCRVRENDDALSLCDLIEFYED